MISWEDTVIKEGEVIKNQRVVFQDFKLLEAQAEISFPAGEKQGYEKGIREGAKEAYLRLRSQLLGVQEFIDYSDRGMKEFRKMSLAIVKPDWQVKLKEWGID